MRRKRISSEVFPFRHKKRLNYFINLTEKIERLEGVRVVRLVTLLQNRGVVHEKRKEKQ